MKLIVRPAAGEDIYDQYEYYAMKCDNVALAERFVDAVNSGIAELLRQPNIASPRAMNNQTLSRLRSWRVEGFPSSRIYFVADGEILRVIRVLHGKRDVVHLLDEFEDAD